MKENKYRLYFSVSDNIVTGLQVSITDNDVVKIIKKICTKNKNINDININTIAKATFEDYIKSNLTFLNKKQKEINHEK